MRAPPRVLPDAVRKTERALPAPTTKCGPEFLPTFFFSSADRRLVTVTVSVVESASVPGKKLTVTDRRRWPAVTQHEVLILTRDIMSLQRYRPKSA